MILLLDIGNTRIKWALEESGQLQSGGVIPRGANDVAILCDQVKQRGGASRLVISNVAGGGYAERLRGELRLRLGCPVEFVETLPEGFGVVNGYDDPRQLGVDRWLALIAAHHAFDGPLCVIDCGTALTVDLLERDGTHLGGMIVPGVKLMQDALVSSAEQLNLARDRQMGDAPCFVARNTVDAIKGGVRYAQVALIERVISDARSQLGDEMEVVLTGGGADELKAFISANYRHEPELVLKGVAIVAEAGR